MSGLPVGIRLGHDVEENVALPEAEEEAEPMYDLVKTGKFAG